MVKRTRSWLADTAKFYEVQKFCSLTNHVWDGCWIVANARAWRGLPDDLKAVVSRNFNDMAVQQRNDIAKLNDELIQTLQQKGLVFNKTDPAPFRKALRKAGFYTEWRGRYGDAAWAVLEQFSGNLT